MEQRVGRLENDMKDVKASLTRLEMTTTEIKAILSQMPRMSDYAALTRDFGALKSDVTRVEGKISGFESRLSAMPTSWQMITFTVGSILASAGLAFAIARFLRP